MDVSVLRRQYRSSRETQRRHTQVLLFGTVLDELSDTVSIVSVTQGLTSSPNNIVFPPPNLPTTHDPWHVHLGLHRRTCSGVTVQLPAFSQETPDTGDHSSSRRSSTSSSESRVRNLSGDSTLDPLSSFRQMSPCSFSKSTKEAERFHQDKFKEGSVSGSTVDPDHVSISRPLHASKHNPIHGSGENDLVPGSLTSSDESTAPVTSITCSLDSPPTNQNRNLRNSQSPGVKPSHNILRSSSTPTWRVSRKLFTRHLSAEGVSSSSGVHLNQDHYPFPNRKTLRVSEAARRLGMYSSF